MSEKSLRDHKSSSPSLSRWRRNPFLEGPAVPLLSSPRPSGEDGTETPPNSPTVRFGSLDSFSREAASLAWRQQTRVCQRTGAESVAIGRYIDVIGRQRTFAVHFKSLQLLADHSACWVFIFCSFQIVPIYAMIAVLPVSPSIHSRSGPTVPHEGRILLLPLSRPVSLVTGNKYPTNVSLFKTCGLCCIIKY